VRLALHPTGEIGHRAGRILLAERTLEALGIYGSRLPGGEERRAMVITDLAGFTVLATDDTVAPFDLAAIAAADGLSCALSTDAAPAPDLAQRFASAGTTLLTGASLRGLAEALAGRALADAPPEANLLLAWTREGKSVPRGVTVPFPQPVGPRRGTLCAPLPEEPGPAFRVEVPLPGPWAGALARVTVGSGPRRQERLVAVADDRLHLEAIALAAGALALATGTVPSGAVRPGRLGPVYLEACLRAGLEVATLGRRG
jgi:hypothetical protein